jgi:hypothetical protein
MSYTPTQLRPRWVLLVGSETPVARVSNISVNQAFFMETIAVKQVKYPAEPGCSNTSFMNANPMKVHQMSEPISGTAGGIIAWKAIGGAAGMTGAGAGLAAYVVMTMTKPRSDQEWHVALISTLIASFCGGAALVKYLGIEHWINEPFGMVGLLGVCFVCGLPGWLIVRSLFNYMEKKKDASIDEIIHDVKEIV